MGIWLLAVVGIVSKWTIPDLPYWLTVTLYISMGWVGLLTILEMLRAVGVRGMVCRDCGADSPTRWADWPICSTFRAACPAYRRS